ncbi:MAG: hypothetical protein Kow00127_03840 [Bacteroidales bacterium]
MYREFSEKYKFGQSKFSHFQQELTEESIVLVNKIVEENRWLKKLIESSSDFPEFLSVLRRQILSFLENSETALQYYKGEAEGHHVVEQLEWREIAAIRLLDFMDNEGLILKDGNLQGNEIVSEPYRILWYAIREGKGPGHPDFFRDMLHLFRQFSGLESRRQPTAEQVTTWMEKHPSGLDPEVIEQRKKNLDRIIRFFIKKIDSGDIDRRKFRFDPGMTYYEKYKMVLSWWNDRTFHLQFAARSPERINRMLDRTLDEETLNKLFDAQDVGIPFFVNPYYLSLLLTGDQPERLRYADRPVRDYIFVSRELVDEFGRIVAWEKEDVVEPGKPNAAGWILPNRKNIHRRYPEVAILIPDTTGRACGGLCVSCQRMYDFQNGHLNFDLEELKPQGTWWERLPGLLKYFENDPQLRDILITGGDALMSSDNSLERILNEIYHMALRKQKTNKERAEGEKYAEILRIRLGTRLPVYLPMRVTDNLVRILKEFREKAQKAGIRQFVIQTHFESAMEVTPEAAEAVKKLLSAGWMVTNQLVFTVSASRRGHTAKLRKVLNDIGVVTYYNFTVKGFRENYHNFTPNARAVQEQVEEKAAGRIPEELLYLLKAFPDHPEEMVANIESLRHIAKIPFLATDRNIMNLPGVGKSLTFRNIGLTPDGRRILRFRYDHTRNHSPAVDTSASVDIIESKSIGAYLRQLEQLGEDASEYRDIWGYSLGETEPRMPIFEYPEYPVKTTRRFGHIASQFVDPV